MNEHLDHFLFYSDNITNENIIFNDTETRHMTNVLRLSEGSEVKVTDGKGTIYTVKLEVISKKSAISSIVDRITFSKRQNISIYIGIPEKDSFERLLPMVIPQGISTIIPVICEFCQKSWWENKWEKVLERYQRVMITSAKQCWNPIIPEIREPIHFKETINSNHSNLFYADEDGLTSCSLSSMEDNLSEISCFVGPPGGFSTEEKGELHKKGTGIKLSEFRLRTELAGSLLISALYSGNLINPLENRHL